MLRSGENITPNILLIDSIDKLTISISKCLFLISILASLQAGGVSRVGI